MAGDILVGYDGQEASVAAIATATAIASAFGRELVIVFGYRPAPIGGDVPSMARAVRDVGEEMTKQALTRVAESDPDVVATVELVDDRPAEAILRAAEEHDALMIVVGSSNKGPITGSLLGSVCYHVIHRSKRPVVVVPAPDDAAG